jgi:hypothetical protein
MLHRCSTSVSPAVPIDWSLPRISCLPVSRGLWRSGYIDGCSSARARCTREVVGA